MSYHLDYRGKKWWVSIQDTFFFFRWWNRVEKMCKIYRKICGAYLNIKCVPFIYEFIIIPLILLTQNCPSKVYKSHFHLFQNENFFILLQKHRKYHLMLKLAHFMSLCRVHKRAHSTQTETGFSVVILSANRLKRTDTANLLDDLIKVDGYLCLHFN